MKRFLNFYRLNSFLHNSVRCDKHNRRSRRDIFYDVGGASIRKKTETSQQGLRFTARLDVDILDNEHGFYRVWIADVETIDKQS